MALPVSCSVIILAAGNSDRMNFPKPFLKWDDQFTFIGKIINEYRTFGCNQIVTVLNMDNILYYSNNKLNCLKQVTVVGNGFPEYERFYSVKIGLKVLIKPQHCFIQNVDNPFVTCDLLTSLYNNKTDSGYTAPIFKDKGGHPVLISKDIITHITGLQEEVLNLKSILAGFPKRTVEAGSDDILYNINTIEDYNRLIKRYN